ncbi:DUF6509 family protein [Cohnella sp.]|uniref:DUF6509 family protein n=1 Tax=Cohnella sp. TaxID=1883426 RepID=UPI00356A7896
MLTITEYSAELVKDPFKILTGKRYEFLLYLDIPEDDELYSEHGIYIKLVYKLEEDQGSIVNYDLIERSTDRILDFDVEEDEEAQLNAFCKENLPED